MHRFLVDPLLHEYFTRLLCISLRLFIFTLLCSCWMVLRTKAMDGQKKRKKMDFIQCMKNNADTDRLRRN